MHFSLGHSQYLAFSLDSDGLSRHGDKGRYTLLDHFLTYIVFYFVHVLTFVTEAYD